MKPEWGQKRKCSKCDTFFYDMRKNEFSCPKCKEKYTADSYEEAKHKQLLKLAKKAAPKIDDVDLNEEALLQMTEDVPLMDEDLGNENGEFFFVTEEMTEADFVKAFDGRGAFIRVLEA